VAFLAHLSESQGRKASGLTPATGRKDSGAAEQVEHQPRWRNTSSHGHCLWLFVFPTLFLFVCHRCHNAGACQEMPRRADGINNKD